MMDMTLPALHGPPPGDAPGSASVPAGFWVRGGALLIDMVVLSAFGWVFGTMMEALGASTKTTVIATLSCDALYVIGMTGTWGATLGKMAAGVVVRRPDGSPIGYGRAISRFFATYLSTLPANIGHIMAGLTKRKRALHDFIVNTEVVFVPGAGANRRRTMIALGVASPLLYGAVGIWIGREIAKPMILLRQADAAERAGDFEAAAARFDELVKLAPKSAEAWNGRCWELALLGRAEQALPDCDKALEFERSSDILDSRGLALLKLKRYDESFAAYDEAVRLAPSKATHLYGRGMARRGKGDKGGGNADLAGAARIDPNVAAEYHRYGVPSPVD